MSFIQFINTGLATATFAAFIYVGRKLEKLDVLEKSLDSLKNDVEYNIKPDIRDIRERLGKVETKMAMFENSIAALNQVVFRK